MGSDVGFEYDAAMANEKWTKVNTGLRSKLGKPFYEMFKMHFHGLITFPSFSFSINIGWSGKGLGMGLILYVARQMHKVEEEED